jgi:Nucleotidyl transferase
VSNCINSDINKIYCLTQFNSASLNRHLSSAYNSNVGSYTRQGFVEVLAAQQSPENPDWFQGTADAVRQYLWLFKARTLALWAHRASRACMLSRFYAQLTSLRLANANAWMCVCCALPLVVN